MTMKAYVLSILISCFLVESNAKDKQFLRDFDGETVEWEIGSINTAVYEFIVHQGRSDRDNFKCPYQYGAFPDPRDCSRFYVCKHGKSTHNKCQRNMLFDVHRRTCLPRWIAVCGDGKEGYSTRDPRPTPRTGSTTPKNDDDFKCNSLYGSYPHPTKCEKYYTCVLFKATLQTCPKSQLFDVAKKTCMSEDKVNCGNRERPFVSKTTRMEPSPTPEKETTFEETDSTEPEPETTFSETPSETPEIITEQPTTIEIETEEPTTKEIETEEPTTTEIQTEEPTTTEIETEEPTTTEIQTEEPTTTEIETEEPTTTETPTTRPTGPPDTDCDEDDVDCIITETGEVSDWFICPEDMGAYEHPSSNRLFIFCLNWKPSVKRCGQDLIFSTKLATCVQPETDDDLSSE